MRYPFASRLTRLGAMLAGVGSCLVLLGAIPASAHGWNDNGAAYGHGVRAERGRAAFGVARNHDEHRYDRFDGHRRLVRRDRFDRDDRFEHRERREQFARRERLGFAPHVVVERRSVVARPLRSEAYAVVPRVGYYGPAPGLQLQLNFGGAWIFGR